MGRGLGVPDQDWRGAGHGTSFLGGPVRAGRDAVKDIVGKVWPYVLAGIAVGAGIHGYVPENFMASIMGKGAWWSYRCGPDRRAMYSNAAGIIPVVQALLGKGAALGTVLAFMNVRDRAVTAEMIILRKVLRPPLIATFAGWLPRNSAGRLPFQYRAVRSPQMNVKILGSGAPGAKQLYAEAQKALAQSGVARRWRRWRRSTRS